MTGQKKKNRHLKYKLDQVYDRYHRREFVDPDPLGCVYPFQGPADREIAALIAASLAYGRVSMIMAAVEQVLAVMQPSPHCYVKACTAERLEKDLDKFVYRFARKEHVAALIMGIQAVLEKFGSIENCFASGVRPEDETVLNALNFFYEQMGVFSKGAGHLLADPGKNSACKRLHLFLRWMIRCDRVDPGGWTALSPALLVIPLDVHMHRCGQILGLTRRKQADLRTAIEITDGFRQLSPEDPVKYDFCLTRFGIRKAMDPAELEKFVNEEIREDEYV